MTDPRSRSRAVMRRRSLLPDRRPPATMITSTDPIRAATDADHEAGVGGAITSNRLSATPASPAAIKPMDGIPTIAIHDPAADGPAASDNANEVAPFPCTSTTDPRLIAPPGRSLSKTGRTGRVCWWARANGVTSLAASARRAAASDPSDVIHPVSNICSIYCKYENVGAKKSATTATAPSASLKCTPSGRSYRVGSASTAAAASTRMTVSGCDAATALTISLCAAHACGSIRNRCDALR